MRLILMPLDRIFDVEPHLYPENYFQTPVRTQQPLSSLGIYVTVTRYGFESDGHEIQPLGGVLYIPQNGYLIEEKAAHCKGEPFMLPSKQIYVVTSSGLWPIHIGLSDISHLEKFRHTNPAFSKTVDDPDALISYIAMYEERYWSIGELGSLVVKDGPSSQPTARASIGWNGARVYCEDGINYTRAPAATEYLRVMFANMRTLDDLKGPADKKYPVKVHGNIDISARLLTLADIRSISQKGHTFDVLIPECGTLIRFSRAINADSFRNFPCVINSDILRHTENDFLIDLTEDKVIQIQTDESDRTLHSYGSNFIYQLRMVNDGQGTVAKFLGLGYQDNVRSSDTKGILIELVPSINVGDPVTEENSIHFFSGG